MKTLDFKQHIDLPNFYIKMTFIENLLYVIHGGE